MDDRTYYLICFAGALLLILILRIVDRVADIRKAKILAEANAAKDTATWRTTEKKTTS